MTVQLNLNILQVIPIVIWFTVLVTIACLIGGGLAYTMAKNKKVKVFLIVLSAIVWLASFTALLFWGIIPFGFVSTVASFP
jgi:hypothetical protein